jgi:hypothetical protein
VRIHCWLLLPLVGCTSGGLAAPPIDADPSAVVQQACTAVAADTEALETAVDAHGCQGCVEVWSSIVERCVPSGLAQCPEGRCVNDESDCDCVPTCKACVQGCTPAHSCAATQNVVCKDGSCRRQGDCDERCNKGKGCAFCTQECRAGVCVATGNLFCLDGSCVDNLTTFCGNLCRPPCDPCTEMCTQAGCTPSGDKWCPDGSCIDHSGVCPPQLWCALPAAMQLVSTDAD